MIEKFNLTPLLECLYVNYKFGRNDLLNINLDTPKDDLIIISDRGKLIQAIISGINIVTTDIERGVLTIGYIYDNDNLSINFDYINNSNDIDDASALSLKNNNILKRLNKGDSETQLLKKLIGEMNGMIMNHYKNRDMFSFSLNFPLTNKYDVKSIGI